MRGMRAVLLIGVVVGLLGGVIAFAQPPKMAPLNPKFVEYRENLRAGKLPPMATKSGHHLGYIPPPVSLSQINKGKRIPVRQALPPRYDLRTEGRLTPVKDQNPYGACWAFATYGSLESCTLTASGEVWDFSENNLINWTADNYDPISPGQPFGWYGGNAYTSTAYLSGWLGPVLEADDPYPNPASWSPRTIRKHIQQVFSLPDRAGPLDNDIIKQAVIQYGAVYSMIYYDDAYFNSSSNAYYYDGLETGNHAICIVGWDDNYPRTNFLTQPPGDGAFICRNSWGSSWGEGGYFYVSYYDSQIGAENAVFLAAEDVHNYRRIYQYDPLGLTGLYGYDNYTAWFANVFTATSDELISAVSFYAVAPNSTYSIYVYTNVSEGQPRSGSLSGTKEGIIPLPGYYTIRLDNPLPVASGQKFSVVINITTPGIDTPIPVELPVQGYSSKASANPGESFASPDGAEWEDLSTYNANACVKAFSMPTTLPLKSVDKTVASLGEQLTYTIQCKNESDHTASGIIITDVIPQNTDYVEGSATGNPTYDSQKKVLTWQIASLSPGSSVSYSFKVKILGGEKVINKATLTYEGLSVDSPSVSTYVLTIGKEVPLCTHPANQYAPRVYGDKVVWMDDRNGNFDIYMSDLTKGQEVPICTEPHDQINPAIYGDKVVWEDYRNGYPDIYMKNLTTGEEHPICTNPSAQYNPSIYGDKIVWVDGRNGNYDICMFDITSGKEIPICTEPHDQINPAIYGDKVVWEDYRNGYPDIYMKNLTTGEELPVCNAPDDQVNPSICGHKVVWSDWRNGNGDIYMKDLATGEELPVCTAPGDQVSPSIFGNMVVWEDYRNGNGDIYMKDLSTGKEYTISAAIGDQSHPSISGDKIAWEDYRSGNYDIYIYLLQKVDTAPPAIKILSPLTQGEICGPALLIAQIVDSNLDEKNIHFYLDGKELTPIYSYSPAQQFSATSASLSSGSHKFRVEAWDTYMNEAEVEISFKVASNQVIPPQAKIVFWGFPFQPGASVDKILTFEESCIWDGNRYVPSTSPNFPTDLGHCAVWFRSSQPFNPSQVKPLGSIYPADKETIIPLRKGWNAIRLPWSYSLPLTGLLIEDKTGKRMNFSDASDPQKGNLVGPVLFRWDGTKYVSVGLQQGMENKLYPWFGYWIRAKDDCKLVLPKEPWNVKGQRSASEDGFCLPIKAVFQDGRSEEVYIGMGSKDINSPFPPPSPYSPSERGLFLLKQGEPLYLDIRQKGGIAEWQLAVRGDATLLFPNLSSLPKGWQIILSDGDKRYYPKTISSVKVEGEKVLKIEIGEKLTVPLVIGMLEARASRGGVSISWNVNLPCQTRIVVKGMDGRVFKDLGLRSSSAGLNSLAWDGKDGEGRSLPAGIYIIELTARDEMNQMVKAIKGVILR